MAINEWWTDDPDQKYWMEITDRRDLGGELKAPHLADDNRPKWGYELVRYVKPGDVVLHWYTRRGRRLIGFSVVAGTPQLKEMKWQSRGTSGRASPSLLVDEPAWTAPLKELTYLAAPVTRQDLQSLQATVLDVQARLKDAYGGASLYLPFYRYASRELRATQSYLAKFPAQLIPVLGLDAASGFVLAEQVEQSDLRVATLSEVWKALRGLHLQKGVDGFPKCHQPLALLWAIGRARQGAERLASWPTARAQIGDLIRRFGRPTDKSNPYLPFLALNRTALWELTPQPPQDGESAATPREWLNHAMPPVKGGLTQGVYNLMVMDADAAATVAAGLLDTYFNGIDAVSLLTATGLIDLLSGRESSDQEEREAETLLDALARNSNIVAAESSKVESTEYERRPGKVIVCRGEAQLVDRYLQTLGAKPTRLQLAVGFTDLYHEETADLIEAKVSAEHRYVRQALGQLLDYAAHCAQPINRLTALFPTAPAPADLRLLHLYGIDCLHWVGGTTFHRLQAPTDARERIRPAWGSP